jgi:hypothetical protein
MTTKLNLIFREKLRFHAENLGSERTQEEFEVGLQSSEVAALTNQVVYSSLELLDRRFWPSEIGIDFESWGRICFPDGSQEELPISLVVSQQRPRDSRVRLGMYVLPETSFTKHTGDIVYTFSNQEELQWVGRSVRRWMRNLSL